MIGTPRAGEFGPTLPPLRVLDVVCGGLVFQEAAKGAGAEALVCPLLFVVPDDVRRTQVAHVLRAPMAEDRDPPSVAHVPVQLDAATTRILLAVRASPLTSLIQARLGLISLGTCILGVALPPLRTQNPRIRMRQPV